MTSPPPSTRPSPPRRALHERSESHTNERASPTLRIIGDPQAHIYSSSPFPTLPSQILSPKGGKRQGLVFDDEGGVSHEENPTRQPAHGDQEQPHIIVPKGKVTADFGRSNGSDVELSPTNPSLSSSPFAREPNQTVTLERQTDEHSGAMDQGFDDSGRSSDEIVQLPSVSDSAGLVGSPVIGFYQDEIRDPQSVALKASDASLSSTGSTETVIKHKKRSSYSIFPPVRRPTSSSSARSISAPLRPTGKESRDGLSPLASSFSPSEARRISSLPSHASLQAAVDSGANIQYPVIRAPSYARSWAESSIGVPKRSDDRKASDKWNPHLSTVHSEAHQSSSSRNSALPSETSSMAVHRSSDLSNLPEMPQPAFVRQRDASGSTIRVVNGGEDDVSNLPSPFFHSRGSAFFSVLSRETNQELGRSPLETAPGSRGNLFTNSVPSWARQRNNKQEQKKSGSRGSEIADETQNARDSMLGAPGSSTEASESRPQSNPSAVSDNFSLRIFRTRNRPPDIITQRQHRDSMAITPITATDDNLVEIVGPLRRKVSDIWSPHLWHDKRTTLRRRSMFKPPSLDEQAEGNALNRRNTQIMLFAVGFLVPLAWIVAALLPLPPKPVLSTDGITGRNEIARDLEKTLGSVDEARYENARWWRNVNRVMSVVGLVVIIVIIVLAVITAR